MPGREAAAQNRSSGGPVRGGGWQRRARRSVPYRGPARPAEPRTAGAPAPHRRRTMTLPSFTRQPRPRRSSISPHAPLCPRPTRSPRRVARRRAERLNRVTGTIRPDPGSGRSRPPAASGSRPPWPLAVVQPAAPPCCRDLQNDRGAAPADHRQTPAGPLRPAGRADQRHRGGRRRGGVHPSIEGEAGIGTTSLLEEALGTAGRSAWRCQGDADELERRRPFGAIIDAWGSTGRLSTPGGPRSRILEEVPSPIGRGAASGRRSGRVPGGEAVLTLAYEPSTQRRWSSSSMTPMGRSSTRWSCTASAGLPAAFP